ncbi:hypothetical protein BGZ92_010120 [Podila epicladia]|nr:hypothetical protein BGZ92_010120 [Podila epicladia]
MIEQKAQRLLAACSEGNLDLVNRIASKFETPEEMCETDPTSGYSPLMMAARHGHAEIAEVLIRLGHDRAEISRDANNNNVLMITAEHGHQAVFELYANNFPRAIQLCNNKGWSPLTTAARFGAAGMVEILLHLGADLNHKDEDGSTALHHAAAYGHLQTIALLIEKGGSSTIKNNGGWTALDFAFSGQVAAFMEERWRSLNRRSMSSHSSFSSLHSASGQDSAGSQLGFSTSPKSMSGSHPHHPVPAPLTNASRKESWTSLSNGPLSPILASISGATSPILPSNAWSEFKRVTGPIAAGLLF